MSARGDRLSLLLLLAVVVLVFVAVVVPGPVPVLGNLHDLFIPLNAAEAVRDGVRLHHDLHSPFGWVYFQLNHLADVLMAHLAPWASTPGTLMLSGVLFFVPVVGIWLLFRRALPPNPVLGFWLLPFLFALMVSPREADEFTHKNLLWYGLYNNHNWALILLQAAAFATLARGVTQIRSMSLAGALALCVYLTAHYKISFFFSSLALLAACALLLPHRERGRVLSGVGVLLAVLVLATWLAGYDYRGYLQDILMALDAKRSGGAGYGDTVLASIAVLFVVFATLANTTLTRKQAFLAGALAVAGVAVGVAGDWSGYLGYLLLLACLVVVGVGDGWPWGRVTLAGAWLFIALNLVLNVMSVGRVLELKIRGEEKTGYQEAAIVQHDGRALHVVVPEAEGITLAALADFYNISDDKVWVKLATFAGEDRRVLPRYEKVEYMHAHAEALAWRATHMRKSEVIGEVEFINPFPVLTDSGQLEGLHWLHLGNTLRMTHLPAALEHILEWDVILIPVVSVDGTAQVKLNCAALGLLRDRAPDTGLARASEHYIYLMRDADAHRRERWRELDQSVVQPACRELAAGG